MLHQQIAQEAGKSTPINGETCTAHHMPAGLRNHENNQTNTSGNSIPGQAFRDNPVAHCLIATWKFAVNLVRLKNVGLALWITCYELATDSRGSCK